MAQLLQVKNKGLYTAPNEFSSIPEGALLTADNCVITIDNILESRRGFDRIATLPLSTDRFERFEYYQDQQMAFWTGGKLGYKNGAVYTTLTGTFNDPDSLLARKKFLLSQSNLYFTTDAGIYKQDAYTTAPILAGMFKGLDIQVTLTGSSGFLANNNQTAYRVVWGIRDAQNNLILGAPSGRAVLINTSGGTRDGSLTFTIPSGITTSHFFQVYRSKDSGGAAVEPDDELGLVYENNPSSAEITAGTVTFTDSTTNDLRGATIYTAPSQQGISQANERPPQAEDIEEFENCIVYANTKSKHRRTLTLLSAAALVINDTLTIAGTTYTVKATENIALREFQKFTAGTPAQNIADTVASLIRVINRNTTNTTVYAYYLSAPGDLPGQMLFEERGLGGASFAVTASANGTAYNPVLPTSGTTVSSSNDDFQNALMFSKSGVGEAVPLVNIRRVGSANSAIRRIRKLRNSLFIFKEREGIYRLTGTAPENFTVELFDSSAKLLAPDSVAVVNNQIWCLSDQGITTVTETGVSVVSRPIENLILDQFGLALDAVKRYSFGVGYETERQYYLWTVTSSTDTIPTQCFVFNTFTQAYTKWPLKKSAAIISPVDDKFYLGEGNSNNLEQERKTRTYTDFVDYTTSVTISSFSGKTVTLSSTSGIDIGDLLFQSDSVLSVITLVSSTTVTVNDTVTWSIGSATVYRAIQCDIEYAPVTGGNPGTCKQFPEISLLFKVARFNTGTMGFATDVSGSFETLIFSGNRSGLWGYFPWGEQPWGGTRSTLPFRTFIPLEKQRGALLRVQFSLRESYGEFKLLGFSLPFRDTGSYVIAK